VAGEFRLTWTKGTRVAARNLVPINAALFSITVGKVAAPGNPETVKDATIMTLFDANYFTALLDELAAAKQSIDVAMFYFGGTKRPNAITSRIAEALIDAHKRDVAVRVLLDLDRPEDIYGSERANKLRFNQLKKAGIMVAFDAPEKANHSKLVVIDRERVMIGSHNWTEGSASRYQEMSFAIASKSLAVSYCTRLDRRFKAAIDEDVVPVP
jgi:phosphatidylserine/phosphatidylglycerophosphate/cardiolipin synthase-like enzyme